MIPRRRAVFLDRDGVLNEDRGDVSRPEDFHWIPGAIPALQALAQAGWQLVVASNQPGIARGHVGPAEYANLTSWMHADLAAHHVTLSGVYHCPHLPDAPLAAWCRQCDCRKPHAGMLRRAARDLKLDLSACVMIGATSDDVAAGRAAGVAACIRISSRLEPAPFDRAGPTADFTCTDLGEAAHWLVSHEYKQHA